MQIAKELQEIIENFDSRGTIFIAGNRNSIKLFDFENKIINIKSFKIPNFFNKIIYSFFRKSKAFRSYDFAQKLTQMGIGTPTPIAYYEQKGILGLGKSFYISEHLEFDLMFRDLVENQDYPNSDEILKQFTAFSFKMHQNGIEFLDHSPGNTLIVKNGNLYKFYLVDLNRMSFHKNMDFQLRMKNLSRLTPHIEMIKKISVAYAQLSGENESLIFNTLWKYTSEFQYRYFRKKRIKKRLKFWV